MNTIKISNKLHDLKTSWFIRVKKLEDLSFIVEGYNEKITITNVYELNKKGDKFVFEPKGTKFLKFDLDLESHSFLKKHKEKLLVFDKIYLYEYRIIGEEQYE